MSNNFKEALTSVTLSWTST